MTIVWKEKYANIYKTNVGISMWRWYQNSGKIKLASNKYYLSKMYKNKTIRHVKKLSMNDDGMQ